MDGMVGGVADVIVDGIVDGMAVQWALGSMRWTLRTHEDSG
mgnify:CR=1 FL=1